MSFFLRLWWWLTLPRDLYLGNCRTAQMVEDMKTLAVFFDLKLEQTQVWKAYDVPYNPLRWQDAIDEALGAALRAETTKERRTYLYRAFCLTDDITAQHLSLLRCTPEWHDFQDWLKDE